jgi:hypothetical protein
MPFDKQITRACANADVTYIAYGRAWRLDRGGIYRVEFNRKRPGKSKLKKVGQR